jgi:uncharacterized protein (DUF1330 family)
MLSDEELSDLVGWYEPHPAEALPRWRALFDPTAAGPIALINRFKLRDPAALMRYAAVSIPALAKVGGRFLVSSDAATPLFGSAPDADLVVVGWYPDRAALLALLRDPDYRAAFEDRRTAVESQWVAAAPML